ASARPAKPRADTGPGGAPTRSPPGGGRVIGTGVNESLSDPCPRPATSRPPATARAAPQATRALERARGNASVWAIVAILASPLDVLPAGGPRERPGGGHPARPAPEGGHPPEAGPPALPPPRRTRQAPA